MQELEKLKGIAAMLEYMASADSVDHVYTKEALSMLADELHKIIEEEGG